MSQYLICGLDGTFWQSPGLWEQQSTLNLPGEVRHHIKHTRIHSQPLLIALK
jgi:hypothetical protein